MLPNRPAFDRLAIALACCALSTVCRGQEARHEHEPPVRRDAADARANDPHQEIEQLMAGIELRLREIDRLLKDASADERRTRTPGTPTDLGALLRRSRDGTQRSVEDYDRILELIQHPHPPGGS